MFPASSKKHRVLVPQPLDSDVLSPSSNFPSSVFPLCGLLSDACFLGLQRYAIRDESCEASIGMAMSEQDVIFETCRRVTEQRDSRVPQPKTG